MNGTERLIRAAFEAEAERAVDPGLVLAELERRRARPRRRGLILVAAAAVVVAAIAAVVLPRALDRGAPPVATPPAATQNVLLVGLDDAGNADSMVLGRLGADGSASAISLPRDSWVDLPGFGMGELGSAYARGGATTLVGAVRELTGVQADHFVLVDLAGVARISTAAGGVPVCLQNAVDDRFSGASFPAGRQVLSGPAALAFLRQRRGLPNGDLDRVVRLQVFLRALAHQAVSGGKLADPAFLATVRDNVRVDQGWHLLDLAGALSRVGDLRLGTIPLGDVGFQTPQGAAIQVDPARVRSFVQGFAGSGDAGATESCVH
jgi:LCP family protein required for cell wall assembly